MRSHSASDRSVIPSVCAPGSTRSVFPLVFLCLFLFSVSCTEETPPEPPPEPDVVTDAPPATHLRVHTLSLQNTAFNTQQGKGYADLYAGAAYGGQDAANNADSIDFRHQYRGRDIANQRSFESLITKTRWDRLGLFANITPTESKIGKIEMDAGTFDLIENADALLESFDFQPMIEASASRYRRAYLTDIKDEPVATVFAFIDKKGRRGLFKVVDAGRAPIDTVSEGTLTIEVKIEDRRS